MLLVCKCGTEKPIQMHKDGYEIVRFVCNNCRYIAHLKQTENEVRITLQNGDWYYVKKAAHLRRRA